MNYDRLEVVTNFAKLQVSNLKQMQIVTQENVNDFSITENDNYESATLTYEETKDIKDHRKNMLYVNRGFSIPNKDYYFPEESSNKKIASVRKNLIFSRKNDEK